MSDARDKQGAVGISFHYSITDFNFFFFFGSNFYEGIKIVKSHNIKGLQSFSDSIDVIINCLIAASDLSKMWF